MVKSVHRYLLMEFLLFTEILSVGISMKGSVDQIIIPCQSAEHDGFFCLSDLTVLLYYKKAAIETANHILDHHTGK